jgi:murein DD-endopeptidase MepM/ murein hydrolase activator NlpD
VKFVDRLLTIVVTATIVSMFWIVAGNALLNDTEQDGSTENQSVAATAPEEDGSPQSDPTRTTMRPASPSMGGAERMDEAEQANLVIPVLQVSADQLIDSFNDERGGGVRLHEAIDIMAPTGTSVISAGEGTLEKIFQSDAGGKTLYVRSSDGRTLYYYAHLNEYAPGLREGMKIRRGQRLGAVGFTGNADEQAPHLHFAILRTTPDAEWWEPANAINPYPLLGGK